MTTRGTALLAGPHPVLRAGLATALRSAGVDVVAEVETVAAAVEAAVRLRPGVCVLDESIRGGAIVATKRLTAAAPETLVVVLGTSADEASIVAAVRAGASGYLPRSTSASGLGRAVRAVLEGGAAIPRKGVTALVRELQAGGVRRRGVNGHGIALTEREATVVELLRAGLSTREIADELDLSPVTVRRYLSAVARKVGVDGREALLRTLPGI
jgi:DNA-binding NarL/FixJ family response regulator